MNTSKRSSVAGFRGRAFTLIEVLVVVAIIALLVSVLMPALKSAKESAKATVCLSNLKQQGNGFAAYSKDNKQYLPVAGQFRYFLMDGGYQSYPCFPNLSSRWFGVNNGGLFPKYTGNSVELFYCASNMEIDADGENGKKLFLNNYNNPTGAYPNYKKAHDTFNAPIGAYEYGIPLATGRSPRDGTKEVYTKDSMFSEVCPDDPPGTLPEPSIYYQYTQDATLPTTSPLVGLIPPVGQRGKSPCQALLTDAYFVYKGYHVNGFNVLFTDFHAKRVGDASKKITGLGGNTQGTYNSTKANIGIVWDYFSRNP